MTSPAHRCLIVDDSTAFCRAAGAVLESAGMTVVGTASTLATALASARATRPDLILVDIDLGGENGFDVVEALHAADPRPMVVLVSTHDAADFADMVESSSAVGFLPKFELSAESLARLTAVMPSRRDTGSPRGPGDDHRSSRPDSAC